MILSFWLPQKGKKYQTRDSKSLSLFNKKIKICWPFKDGIDFFSCHMVLILNVYLCGFVLILI